MPWRLAGTREKSYRVGTADEMAAWVDDAIETLTDGWIPLFSEQRPDGTLRVLYGRLPYALEAQDELTRPTGGDSRGEGTWSAVAVLAVALLLVAFVIFLRAV